MKSKSSKSTENKQEAEKSEAAKRTHFLPGIEGGVDATDLDDLAKQLKEKQEDGDGNR